MAVMTAAPRPMISATASTRRTSMTRPFRLVAITNGYDSFDKLQTSIAARPPDGRASHSTSSGSTQRAWSAMPW